MTHNVIQIGNTALHEACRKGNVHIVKSLIAHGAVVNAIGWDVRDDLLFRFRLDVTAIFCRGGLRCM
jgi:hypothetical protein